MRDLLFNRYTCSFFGTGLAATAAEWFVNGMIQWQQAHIGHTPDVVSGQMRSIPTWFKLNENTTGGYAFLIGVTGLAGLLATVVWTRRHANPANATASRGLNEHSQLLPQPQQQSAAATSTSGAYQSIISGDEQTMNGFIAKLGEGDFNLNAVLELAYDVLTAGPEENRTLSEWKQQKADIIAHYAEHGTTQELLKAAAEVDDDQSVLHFAAPLVTQTLI